VEQRKPRRHNTAALDKIVLLENISGISFSFLQTASMNGEPGWVPEWQDKTDLPEAVQIRIERQLKSGNIIQASAIAYTGR
jgi:hypothetical protein